MKCQICNLAEATTKATISSKKKGTNVTFDVCQKCADIMK